MARSVLESLVKGAEGARTILLQDSSQCNGRLLLKAIALQSLQRFSSCHLFLFDEHPEPWLRCVSRDLVQSVTVHDCCTDHLGWGSGTGSGPAPLHEATPSSFLHELSAKGQGAGGQRVTVSDCVVVIDSLSTLLDFHPTPHVCQLVHQLGRQCGIVVCLLHSDLHDSHVTSHLSHVMSTRIQVTPVSPAQTDCHFQVGLQHVSPSGKLLSSVELVTISSDYEVMSVPSSDSTHSLQGATDMVPPDPTANLTFDLTLSEWEREERSKLVLPYHHSAQKKTALLQAGRGRIFYQPDEADDYDDSDPDDDLDI